MADVIAFHDLIHAPAGARVIDVRPAPLFVTEHLDMARNIPFDAGFVSRLGTLNKDSVTLFYDTDGSITPSALRAAQQAGHKHVFGLAGGLQVWKAKEQGHLTGGSFDLSDMDLGNFKTLSHVDFHNLMHNMRDLQILDVRSAEEYTTAHITDAVNYDLSGSQFGEQIFTFSTTKPVLVYGRNGAQAARAAAILKEKGFQVIYDMDASFEDFKNARYGHVEPASAIPPAGN
jgi:rhodanese-related sulfurtransferase